MCCRCWRYLLNKPQAWIPHLDIRGKTLGLAIQCLFFLSCLLDPCVHKLRGPAEREPQDGPHRPPLSLHQLHRGPLGVHLPQPISAALLLGSPVQDAPPAVQGVFLQVLPGEADPRPAGAVPSEGCLRVHPPSDVHAYGLTL